MKLIVLAGFILFNINCLAQTDSLQPKLPPFLQLPNVPSYKLLLMDSSTYTYKYQLKKDQPVIVIYFSPDCEHCQTGTKHITDSMKLFKKVQFVFASYAKFLELKKFHEDYGLATFKNIIYGRDEQFFFPRFYNVRYTPFIAVYDKEGKLVRVFEGGTTVAKLAALCNE
jgi:thiol-disulfide isomerase/thioredoxin